MARRSRSGDKALSAEDLQVIHQEIERLEARVQTLLDFARPMQSRRRECDLAEIAEATIELVRSRARQQGVSIEYSHPPHKVSVRVDPDQISSVLVNLYFNALDAMPGGGQLTIRLAVAVQAELTVTDDGPGIAPELVDRLFTPFVSSKSTGTGLGLSVSRRIVEEHGGTLTGANRVGTSGACFAVRLPVSGDGHADSPPRR